MSKAEERKAAFIEAVAPRWSGLVHNLDDGRDSAERAWDSTLKYFEDTDQKPLADAIRFGLKPVSDADRYRIDYPETD